VAIDPKFLDDLATRLANAIPTPLRDLQNDVEKNMRAVLQSAFSRMNLVTREEFEVQSQVLAQLRIQLNALEQQVTDLEAKLQAPTAPTP
jgi:BMFP domain-containing protein YqiC